MKKSVISIAILTLGVSAIAQTGPAPAGNNAQPAVSTQAAGTGTASKNPTGFNPFTGTSKEQENARKDAESLKQASDISKQKLQLQRDEVEALRIELDRKQLLEKLNPPPPPPPAPKEKVAVKKRDPIPPVIISPTASKFETPELLGTMEGNGSRFALVKFEGATFRVQEGSQVGGKPVSRVSNTGFYWGETFLSNAKKGFAGIVLTEKSKKESQGPATTENTSVAVSTPSNLPAVPGSFTLNPQGATRTSAGATGPTGVLGILPPPPPTLPTMTNPVTK